MVLALVGLLVTFAWLLISVWYVEQTVGFEGMMLLLPNEIGQFIIGVFAPIAFLWLILGFFHVAQRLRRLEDNLWHQPMLRHEALPPRAAAGTSFRAALQTDEPPAAASQQVAQAPTASTVQIAQAESRPVPPPASVAPPSPAPTSPPPMSPPPSAAPTPAEPAVLTLSEPVPRRPEPAPAATARAQTGLPPRPPGFEPRRSASPAARPAATPPPAAAPEPAPAPEPAAAAEAEPEPPRGLAAKLRSRFRDLEARDEERRREPAARSLNPLSLLGGGTRRDDAPAPLSDVTPAPPDPTPPPVAQDPPPAPAPDPSAASLRAGSPDPVVVDPPARTEDPASRRARSVFQPSGGERPKPELRPRSTFAPAERPRRPREEAAARLASRSAAEGTGLGGEIQPAEPPPPVPAASAPPENLAPPLSTPSSPTPPGPTPPRSAPPRPDPLLDGRRDATGPAASIQTPAKPEPPQPAAAPEPAKSDLAKPEPARSESAKLESDKPESDKIEVAAPPANTAAPAVRITPVPAAEIAPASPPSPPQGESPKPSPAAPRAEPAERPGPAPEPMPAAKVTPAAALPAQDNTVRSDAPKEAAPEPPAQPPVVTVTPKTRETAPAVPPTDASPAEAPAAKAAPPLPAPAPPAAAETPVPSEPPAPADPPRAGEGRPIGFRHLVRITTLDLNTLAMDLSSKLCRPAEHAKALKSYDRGEKDVFFDQVRGQLAGSNAQEALRKLGGDDGQLLERYAQRFDRLLEESRTIDVSGALAKSLEAMAIGRLYGAIQGLRNDAGKTAASGGG